MHTCTVAVLPQNDRRPHPTGLIVTWRDGVCAAARFRGTLTFGVHCNPHVTDATRRPAQPGIAHRAAHQPKDPGKLDNHEGGVSHGQTPHETLPREGHEKTSLAAAR